MPEQRIAGLDGIRAVAVLMVFASHTNNIAHSLEFGSIGVWAFFVLSGFLIVRILYQQRLQIEAKQTSFIAAWENFLKRRTLRIFPIYYLVLGLCALLTLLGPVLNYSGTPWPFYWAYLTNFYIQMSGISPGSFSHLWSLAIEEQFYMVAAPIFLLAPSRFAIYLCGAFIIAGLMRGAMLFTSPAEGTDSIFNFYMLGLGGLTGLLAPHAGQRLASFAVTLLFVALMSLMAIDYGLNKNISQAVLLFPVFAASLYAYILKSQASALVRLLDFGPLRNLGRISYGFYLYHNFVKLDWIRLSLGISFEPSNKLRVALELLITVALAALSWMAIERPLLGLSRKSHDSFQRY
jgi:peptidoglycan/LPS O-acetylase OafA/YrhL